MSAKSSSSVFLSLVLLLFSGFCLTAAQEVPPTNLPPPSFDGVFVANATAFINASIDTVWDVLSDFPKYPDWNPFVRSQYITDADKNVLPDQTPAQGDYLLINTHIPPTFDDSALTETAFEQIIHFNRTDGRMAWTSLLPSWFLMAERWQVLSVTADNLTYYETREVFAGPGAYAIKWFIADNLQAGFTAMAETLKSTAEAM